MDRLPRGTTLGKIKKRCIKCKTETNHLMVLYGEMFALRCNLCGEITKKDPDETKKS